MKKLPLDIYDEMPTAMKAYVTNYGWNFNRKACDFAVKQMRHINEKTNKEEELKSWDKEKVQELLARYGISLENDVLYNSTYVCNMCLADYYQSAVPDEACLALYVKKTIDDVDGSPELPFRFWLQKCIALGIPIEWEDLL